jgi:GT2 family glycosyltransferase
MTNADENLPKLAVLLVCHNRKQTTLRALDALRAAQKSVELSIVLFDDASTDGTATAARELWPEVQVVMGNGNAFWNKGLYEAWCRALALPVDGFLWLNDDVELDKDAINRLVNAWHERKKLDSNLNFILVGATRDDDGKITYSGRNLVKSPFAHKLLLVQPSEVSMSVDSFNGNIVLIPREVVKRIGINDPIYHHNFGDIDYGLRAKRAGVDIQLLAGTFGLCARNEAKLSYGYGSPSLTLLQQWRIVGTHHGFPFASWWRFTGKHSGHWRWLHFLIPYRWLLIPRWTRRIANGRQDAAN